MQFTGATGALGRGWSRVKVPGTGTTLVGAFKGTLGQVMIIGSLLELAGRILKVQIPF